MKLPNRQAIKRWSKYIYVGLLMSLIVLFGFLTFPHIQIPGTDIELENLDYQWLFPNSNYNLQLGRSIDFSEATQTNYNLNLSNPNYRSISNAASDFQQRLVNLGITDYRIEATIDNVSQSQLIVTIPRNPSELQNFNDIINSGSNVEYVQQTQINTTEEDVAPQTSFIPTSIDDSYINNARVFYSNEIGGYGIQIDFAPEFKDQLLVEIFSDINQNQSDLLFLNIGGQAVGVQASFIDSNSARASASFRTLYSNDRLANELIADMINNPNLNGNLSFSGGEPIVISGIYSQLRIPLIITIALAILFAIVSFSWKNHHRVDLSMLYFLQIVLGMALIKIFNIEVGIVSVMALTLVQVYLWFLLSRVDSLQKLDKLELRTKVGKMLFRQTVVISAFAYVLGFLSIAGVDHISGVVVIFMLSALIAHALIYPIYKFSLKEIA